MRSSTRSCGSALVALTLAACTGTAADPPVATDALGCPVVGYRGISALTALPAGTYEDVATYADHVTTFTVTAERFGPAEGEPDEPWVPRWVTVHVDETNWSGSRASDPTSEAHLTVGTEVELLTWPHDGPDRCVGIGPAGNPTLLVGMRYAGAVFHSRGEWSVFPGSSGVLDEAGSFALRSRLLDGLADADAFGARLEAVGVPSTHEDLMALDPMDRFEALMLWSESEPVLPSVPPIDP